MSLADVPEIPPATPSMADWPPVASLRGSSVRALRAFDSLRPEEHKRDRKQAELFTRLLQAGADTSAAVYQLAVSGFGPQAISLGRVRLENLIVSAYLLREDASVALDRYLTYAPIGHYRSFKLLLDHPLLADQVPKEADVDGWKAKAASAQELLRPTLDFASGKLLRSWTDLDLRSMALRCDALVAQGPKWARLLPLVATYDSYYRASSGFIHADPTAFSDTHYLEPIENLQRIRREHALAFGALGTAAAADILQSYELLHWLGRDCDPEYEQILDAYVHMRAPGGT